MPYTKLWQRALYLLRGGDRLRGFPDEHSARDFHLLLTAFLCWTLANQFVIVPLLVERKATVSAIFLVLISACLIGLFLLRQGRKRAAAVAFLGILWTELAVYSFYRGGIHSNIGGTMTTVLILSAWLLGRRATVWLVFVSIVLGFVEAFLEYSGHALPNLFNGTPLALWVGQTGMMLLAVIPILSFLGDLQRQVRALRESQERYRVMAHALESAGDCVSITDTEDRVLYLNGAFLRTYGYRQEEVLGRPMDDFRSKSIPAEVKSAILPATIEGSWSGELWNRTKDGREFPISLAKSVVYDEKGKRIALVGIAQDITERKRAEDDKAKVQAQLQQAQKMESIGRLAGGVAHDFNNLLTVINGYSATLLKQLPADGPLREMAGEIKIAGQRAAELTSQLLLLSRRKLSETVEVNLNDVIGEVGKMLSRVIGEDVRVECVLSPDLGSVKADPAQMNQVLMNLAVNARDAMPEGGTLLIETRNVEIGPDHVPKGVQVKPGRYVELKVSDTGVGMAKETMSHLFEPFFTTKKAGEGTGLGLATVYGIVKQTGGWISAYSEVGKGTSFKIQLPRVDAAAAAPERPKPSAEEMRGTETILVVEDQEQLLKIAASVLRGYGYRVLAAPSPAIAMKQSEEFGGAIDLLLTDVVMPQMTGLELADRLKKARPEMEVIFMSGYSERVIADRRELAGSYLPKPFSPEDLAEKVRGALDAPRRPRDSEAAVRTILVADDDTGVRALLRDLLSEAGYRVIEAVNGKEAVQMAETSLAAGAGTIDLVITDMAMPEQDGFETMAALRRVRPDIRIIAMSGRFAGPLLRAAGHLGAQALLAKPIQLEELLSTVARVLAG